MLSIYYYFGDTNLGEGLGALLREGKRVGFFLGGRISNTLLDLVIIILYIHFKFFFYDICCVNE